MDEMNSALPQRQPVCAHHHVQQRRQALELCKEKVNEEEEETQHTTHLFGVFMGWPALWYAEEHTPWQPKGKQKYPPVIWEQQHLSFCVCIQFAKMYTALYKFILHIIKLLKFFFSFNWKALWMYLFLILYKYKLQLKTTYSIGNKIIQDLIFFFYSVTQQRVCLTG